MSHTIGQAEQDTQESNFNSNQSPQDPSSFEASSSAPESGLCDADYEFLFNQLLEGIAHGWHDRRIMKFFSQLGDRGKQADWVAWLDRLREKVLKLPIESKRQLGTIMVRFGELTQSVAEVNQIGAASDRLGRELLFGDGDSASTIWEYVGPDLSLETKPIETEEELSERLPNDFAALSEELTENVELDSATAAKLPPDDNPSDGIELKIDKSVSETEITLKDANRVAKPTQNSEDTYSETLVSADELWADDLSVADEADVAKPNEDINLDLDLDLGEVSSDEEKLDLDPQSPNLEVESSVDTTKPNVANRGVAADLQSETPISDPNNLANILEAFNRDSDLESSYTEELTTESAMDLDLEERLEQQASFPDSLALNEQKEEMSSAIASELDDSSLELIESWFNLGLKQVSAGEYDKAIASWDKALTINANLPEAWHNRGSALGRLGNYEAAVKSFQNALEIDPDNYQAWNDRAHALYQLQEWSGAVECWSRAIDIMPGNHLFWYNQGCSLEQLSKWAEAIASYEKALEIKPDFEPGRSRYINLVADNSRPN